MGKSRPTRRKLATFFNYTVRVECYDRSWIGVLIGVDRHMNIVLHRAEEVRLYKVRGESALKEVRRTVGMIILRGSEILTVVPEGDSGELHSHVCY